MIYLIKSAAYDNLGGYIDLLKIGYTEDSRKDSRLSQYRLHNPSCKVLFEIPKFDSGVEKKIQYYFRNLRYQDYGREWFIFSQDIIDFFENINDIDVYNLPNSPSSGGRENYWKYFKIIKKCVNMINDISDKKREEYISEIIDKLGSNTAEESVLEYIENDYGADVVNRYLTIEKNRKTGIYTSDKVVNLEVSKFLEGYEKISTIYDRLRFFCEYSMSQDAREIALAQIPDSDNVKSYYLALGPTKMKALSYNITLIRKELGIVTFSQELLSRTVYSEFKVGEKYLLSSLKEKLGNLYTSISYTKTPKALDILEYFEVKEFMTTAIIDEKKKRVRGYELIEKLQ